MYTLIENLFIKQQLIITIQKLMKSGNGRILSESDKEGKRTMWWSWINLKKQTF
jgi:hypothetical protein